jgi:hypothetical protein
VLLDLYVVPVGGFANIPAICANGDPVNVVAGILDSTCEGEGAFASPVIGIRCSGCPAID